MTTSILPVSDLERLNRDEWIHANESKLKRISEQHATEIRTIALRFGIPEAEHRLTKFLQKKAAGPKPISQRIVNGFVVTTYEPWTEKHENKRKVRTVVFGETDSLDRVVDVDEDGYEVRLIDTIGVEDFFLSPYVE